MEELFVKLKNKQLNRIAIMGGTFDPIHYGHLVTAEAVRTRYNFDRVIFIPSGIPPHKTGVKVTSSEHRYTMVQLATASNPYFQVSRMEIDRHGSTYTIDTVKELRSVLGSSLDIYFITGADAVLEILTWKNASELLSMCNFIAVTRPGYDRSVLEDKVRELKEAFNSHIMITDVPAFNISSTEIREKAASKVSIKYLVPESVEQYIKKYNLYNSGSE